MLINFPLLLNKTRKSFSLPEFESDENFFTVDFSARSWGSGFGGETGL
jgi:hypothetical protein